MMKRAYCRDCARFEFRQATEVPATRPMTGFDWSLAIVLGTYFLVVAFVWANRV